MGQQTNNDQEVPDSSNSNTNDSTKESLLLLFTSNPFYEQRADQNKRSFNLSTRFLKIGVILLVILFFTCIAVIITNIHNAAIIIAAFPLLIIIVIMIMTTAFNLIHITSTAFNQAMNVPNEPQLTAWFMFVIGLVSLVLHLNPGEILQGLWKITDVFPEKKTVEPSVISKPHPQTVVENSNTSNSQQQPTSENS